MDLYISSCEYKDFSSPRKVEIIEQVEIAGKECLLVKVDGVVTIFNSQLLRNDELYNFLLVPRFDKKALGKLKSFPIAVHVFIAPPQKQGSYVLKEMSNLAWANVYNNFSDASIKII